MQSKTLYIDGRSTISVDHVGDIEIEIVDATGSSNYVFVTIEKMREILLEAERCIKYNNERT